MYKVALEYLTTDISQPELKKKYGFNGNSTIYRWIAKFGLSKPSDQEIELYKAIKKEQKIKSPKEAKPEGKIAALKKELEHERLRTLDLNTLIDVAELGKPGSRKGHQSAKYGYKSIAGRCASSNTSFR